MQNVFHLQDIFFICSFLGKIRISQNLTRCYDLWVADLMILRQGLKGIKDPVQLHYWAKKHGLVSHPIVIAPKEQLGGSWKLSIAVSETV